MAPRTIILATPRLRLTTWLLGDLDDLARLHADSTVMRHMTSGSQDREQSRERLETFQHEQAARGWSKWRVEDHGGGFLGRAGFGCAHETGHRELGYLLAPSAWGFGYATELAAALVQWHVEHPAAGLRSELRAYVFAANHASLRILEKAGFRLVGPDPRDPRQLLFETRPGLRRVNGSRASHPSGCE